ncbi:TolB family protein [Paractinoplanes durhamensis]|uniref:TolB family protein n=1 Tax=Paractinoplanes durhamensis TaxID=113563 RepID=UPI00363F4500
MRGGQGVAVLRHRDDDPGGTARAAHPDPAQPFRAGVDDRAVAGRHDHRDAAGPARRGVAPAQLSAFLLAGGSSRIPLVSQLLSTEFQRPVVADPHPEHSIAMGAAVATAVVVGGGSPFAAAAPPPRPAESAPTGGYSPISSPQWGGAAVAATGAAPANGSSATGTPTSTNPGAGSPPYGTPTPTYGNAPVSSTPVSSAPTSTPPANGVPGQAAPSHGPLAYSRGSASIPGAAAPTALGTTPPIGMAPRTGAGTALAGGVLPGVPQDPRPWPPPPLPGPPKRNLSKILMVAALVVAVIAGGTAAGLVLLNKSNKDKNAAATPTATTASAAASQAAPVDPLAPPTDTMLIRVDTPIAGGKKESKVYSFTPGSDTRTIFPGTKAGDVLPKWSHSRQQIAMTHNNGEHTSIDVMNADGSDRHEVADDAGGRVAWSADDKKIAFMKKFDGTKQIAVLNLETGELKQLTKTKTQKDDAMWSPDGNSILYWLNRDGVRQVYELTVANPKEPGRQITKPETGQVNDPVYSPTAARCCSPWRSTRTTRTSGWSASTGRIRTG